MLFLLIDQAMDEISDEVTFPDDKASSISLGFFSRLSEVTRGPPRVCGVAWLAVDAFVTTLRVVILLLEFR